MGALMPAEKFVSADALRHALVSLRGTADSMLKVWFTLKQMGFDVENPVLVDTSNPHESLRKLFSYGSSDPTKEFFVPFAAKRSDLTMRRDAARAVIQTNIEKFHDATVGFEPRSFLRIEHDPSGPWKVSAQPGYPQGLGINKDGFAKADTQR